MSDITKHRLTTIEATIKPGERTQLATPIASANFLIESMMTGDHGLRYAALRAERPGVAAAQPGLWGRFWQWWTGGKKTDPIRLIYDAEALVEDQDNSDEDAEPEKPQPQDFEDFMLSLIHGGTTFDPSPDGGLAQVEASEQDEEDQIQLAYVHAGERLLLEVLNPTDKPITAKVTFSGPEIEEVAEQ